MLIFSLQTNFHSVRTKTALGQAVLKSATHKSGETAHREEITRDIAREGMFYCS